MLDPTAGYAFIHWIQQYSSPVLDLVMGTATWLGTEPFYWLFLPLLYWLMDRRTAFRVLALLFVSIFVNDLAKHFFDLPRPSASEVRVLLPETGTGPGFPSGHAQHAVVLWGGLALEIGRAWAWVAAVPLIALISLSRMYLGLHFPLDVIGGLVVGVVLLGLYAWVRRRARGRAAMPVGDAVLAVVLPLLLLVVPWALQVPQLSLLEKIVGFLVGAGLGYVLVRETGMTQGASPGWRAPVKVAAGFAVLLGVTEGSDLIFPETSLLQIVRYVLIGLTATWLVPWLARRLGLEGGRRRRR